MPYMARLSTSVKKYTEMPRCGHKWANSKLTEADHPVHSCVKPGSPHISRGGIKQDTQRHRCACGATNVGQINKS